jgi:hypothetical protein
LNNLHEFSFFLFLLSCFNYYLVSIKWLMFKIATWPKIHQLLVLLFACICFCNFLCDKFYIQILLFINTFHYKSFIIYFSRFIYSFQFKRYSHLISYHFLSTLLLIFIYDNDNVSLWFVPVQNEQSSDFYHFLATLFAYFYHLIYHKAYCVFLIRCFNRNWLTFPAIQLLL